MGAMTTERTTINWHVIARLAAWTLLPLLPFAVAVAAVVWQYGVQTVVFKGIGGGEGLQRPGPGMVWYLAGSDVSGRPQTTVQMLQELFNSSAARPQIMELSGGGWSVLNHYCVMHEMVRAGAVPRLVLLTVNLESLSWNPQQYMTGSNAITLVAPAEYGRLQEYQRLINSRDNWETSRMRRWQTRMNYLTGGLRVLVYDNMNRFLPERWNRDRITPDATLPMRFSAPATPDNPAVAGFALTLEYARRHGFHVTGYVTPVNHDRPALVAQNVSHLQNLFAEYGFRLIDCSGLLPPTGFRERAMHYTETGRRRLAGELARELLTNELADAGAPADSRTLSAAPTGASGTPSAQFDGRDWRQADGRPCMMAARRWPAT